ncbi:unnamed protein product [Linum trigynum]
MSKQNTRRCEKPILRSRSIFDSVALVIFLAGSYWKDKEKGEGMMLRGEEVSGFCNCVEGRTRAVPVMVSDLWSVGSSSSALVGSFEFVDDDGGEEETTKGSFGSCEC